MIAPSGGVLVEILIPPSFPPSRLRREVGWRKGVLGSAPVEIVVRWRCRRRRPSQLRERRDITGLQSQTPCDFQPVDGPRFYLSHPRGSTGPLQSPPRPLIPLGGGGAVHLPRPLHPVASPLPPPHPPPPQRGGGNDLGKKPGTHRRPFRAGTHFNALRCQCHPPSLVRRQRKELGCFWLPLELGA